MKQESNEKKKKHNSKLEIDYRLLKSHNLFFERLWIMNHMRSDNHNHVPNNQFILIT